MAVELVSPNTIGESSNNGGSWGKFIWIQEVGIKRIETNRRVVNHGGTSRVFKETFGLSTVK